MATSVIVDADLELFRKRWIGEFEYQRKFPRRQQDRFWQACQAYSELKNGKNLARVLPGLGNDDLFTSLTLSLVKEVRAYNRCAKDIAPVNQCFKTALKRICSAEERLTNAPLKTTGVTPDVKAILARAVSLLKEQRLALERRRVSYWDDVLLASPEEKSGWPPDFTKQEWQDYGKKWMPSEPPEEVSKWTDLFNRFKYPEQLTRRIDLDSRIQVRMAVVLRYYLDWDETHITRRTIERLVVLTYICGGLAAVPKNGHRLLIVGTVDPLTVGAVQQKLQDAGVK